MPNSQSASYTLTPEQKELLSQLLGDEQVESDEPIRRRGLTRARLSFSQQRLWFLDQLEPEGNPAYNNCFRLLIRGNLDIPTLERAIREIVTRHEVLRTSFEVADGEPVQVIAHTLEVPLRLVDISATPETEYQAELIRLWEAEESFHFNLARCPLLRTLLVRRAPDEHVLVLTIHHIMCDGWTTGILVREMLGIYDAFRAGRPSPFPPLPIQYSDYSEWQRERLQGATVDAEIDYWRSQLAGAPAALDMPTSFPRPSLQTTNGAREPILFPSVLTSAVRAFCQTEGVTHFMVLLAAYQLLLARYSGQRDIVVGSPIAGRVRVETEPLVGLFTNTLALRADCSGNPTVRELLARVKKTSLDAFSHQELPFEKLVEELKPQRDLSRSPIFQVMFILQTQNQTWSNPEGLVMIPAAWSSQFSKFELTLELHDVEAGFAGVLEFNTDLFDPETARRLARHYLTLVAEMVADPDRRVSELQMLTEEERRQVLVDWNRTETDRPSGCLTPLFEEQVERSPDRVAVSCGDRALTYSELNARANQLARHLRSMGVGPEVRVAISLERSVEMLVALLGTMKAGAAYVPLDPDFPPDRIHFMLEDSGASVLLTEESLVARLPQHDTVICIDRDWEAISLFERQNLPLEAVPESLAYVIYTSGSTGKPKGVMIPQGALVNFLRSMLAEPGMTQDDTLLAVTTLSFDIAGLELYLPLVAGARIAIATRETLIDGARLGRAIEETGATILQATPSTWRMLLHADWPGNGRLKALCGGEAFPLDLARQLLLRCGSVWNVYGPTETTIWSTLAKVTEVGTSVPIGRPIANTRIYILDADRQPVPVGVAGELCIGGAGVARGYHNRPELTAEKFLPDPFVQGARVYRTGDLARYLPDGQIECLGRIDDQVKVRGHRIELGEIEAVLAEHSGVRQAAVAMRDFGPGDRRLVAYFVPAEATPPTDFRDFLKRRLPDYMVPGAFVSMPALPLTANGKIDRRALPSPEQGAATINDAEYVAPRTNLERQIAEIWASVLKVGRVGVNDNFFDSGGHSLLLAGVHAELRRVLHAEIAILDLFRYPTVGTLAAFISGTAKTASSAPAEAPERGERRRQAIRRQQDLRSTLR